jgi:hypothetical protein
MESDIQLDDKPEVTPIRIDNDILLPPKFTANKDTIDDPVAEGIASNTTGAGLL